MDRQSLTPPEICEDHLLRGVAKAENGVLQMILLGTLAGAFIALGAFASSSAAHSIENLGIAKLVSGAIFPVGLICVLVCGAELFTGNSLMVIALLEKKISIGQLIKNWVIIYIANFIGVLLIAYLIYSAGLFETNGGRLGGYAIRIAANKGALSFGKAFASGILCNMVVCLAVWGASAAKDIIGKILIIWFPIMAFVVSGFEHCIANMYYFSAGLLAAQDGKFVKLSNVADKIEFVNIRGAISNLVPATLGNIVGGVVFIGLIYWLVYKYVPRKRDKDIIYKEQA